MDEDTASRFVASLVKSIQALCNGYIEFSTSIEVIGHIHLNIDRNCKFNYVLSEEVNKSVSEGSTIFSSHSYHSHPPSSLVPVKASSSVESAKGTHRKSQSVPSVHQGDTAAVTSLQKDVTVSHKDTQKINDYTPQTSLSDRLSESGDSSHSGKFSLNLTYESSSAQSGRLPQTSNTGTPNSAHSKLTSHNQDPLDRRRKAQTEVQTRRTVEPSPKRTRANDSGLGTQDSGFEVIEIKEEPSLEEPCVFFADSNSQIPMGQGDLSSGASRLSDLNQTPDFSKSVMESLERVGQLEGASLINPVDAQIQLQQQPLQQDQPFPVMLHANSAAQASSVSLPGTSNQQGSAPSTSGAINPLMRGNLESKQDPPLFVSFDAELANHTAERGEGRNHRCVVCVRKHEWYAREHPGVHYSKNPFKRSKTSFRCSVCRIYLCAQRERPCWQTWHDSLSHSAVIAM